MLSCSIESVSDNLFLVMVSKLHLHDRNFARLLHLIVPEGRPNLQLNTIELLREITVLVQTVRQSLFGTCASKPLSGTGHCKTSRAKARRDFSCTKGVKRRHSALGAKNKDLQCTAERQVQVPAGQQGREEPMSGST